MWQKLWCYKNGTVYTSVNRKSHLTSFKFWTVEYALGFMHSFNPNFFLPFPSSSRIPPPPLPSRVLSCHCSIHRRQRPTVPPPVSPTGRRESMAPVRPPGQPPPLPFPLFFPSLSFSFLKPMAALSSSSSPKAGRHHWPPPIYLSALPPPPTPAHRQLPTPWLQRRRRRLRRPPPDCCLSRPSL